LLRNRMAAVPDEAVAATPIVDVRGIGKSFRNGTVALQSIDLSVAPGAFLSLLGPSGCGKSTLLRLIAGLTPPSAGRIALSGVAPGKIGFVFQEPTLMPWATVWENVYLPLRLMRVSRERAAPKIETTLAAVGLDAFAKTYPRELSGGMKMRVSIARALVTEPQLLLLDEPFAALDEITRFKLNEDLLALWQSQRWTVIFVTHSVFESVFLSNRIVVMTKRPGRIAADVAIDLAYPRQAALRTQSDYTALCARLSHTLAEAAT
jgi:NitT/TauT family transport system ATP-binding protein